MVFFTSDGLSAADSGRSGAGASDQPPAWAFVWDPSVQVPAPGETPVALPGSNASFSWKQARDLFAALDWHPEAHPAMPDVVANGRKPDVRACGSCHRVEGTGGPENASLAGLPVAYFVQQIADFRSGARRMSGAERPSTQAMLASAKGLTDDDIRAAAEYFAKLARKPVIKVVESDTIPKTGPSRLFYVKSPAGGTETLGQRIVEMPDDVDRFELRDSRATFTAYVPVGSVARGEALVKTGGSGATNACGLCHGSELKGFGDVPAIAGRSPTYIVRQLWEFQHGNRSGGAGALMQQTAERLSQKDMIDIAAYVSSLDP
ncbi:cytochrome C [Bradyrhizobium guangzhouense]|uniref:Cytochrome C n=1 Tax=Bradyrhizobium guangzhouense TaxID=1325095 RepID=A0AAE5X763_9BRAD|nr:cytochrome C [Bradyrhizobium guangzhouense]RXH12415.1 cytochrome C [Bradyrhizobium guangzhouense]